MHRWFCTLLVLAACGEAETLPIGGLPDNTPADDFTMPGRVGMTATYAPEHDGVVVIGGYRTVDSNGVTEIQYPRAVEIIHASPARARVVAELPVGAARAHHTATRLADGRILVTGGWSIINGANTSLRTAYIVDARDPNAVTIDSRGLAMNTARYGHSAVLVPDGTVVITGGAEILPDGSETAPRAIETFDPTTQAFTITGQLFEGRDGSSATLRDDGSIVVAGGTDGASAWSTAAVIRDGRVVERIDLPAEIGPVWHAAAATLEGVVLSGGYTRLGTGATDSAAWIAGSRRVQMAAFRARHTLTAVADALVAVGGIAGTTADATAEWITEDPPRVVALRDGPRAYHATVSTMAGVVIVGGATGPDPTDGQHDTFEVLTDLSAGFR